MDMLGGSAGTEGSTRERRLALRVVEALNLVFLAVDAALYGLGAHRVLAGRLLVSASLLGADRVLSARVPSRQQRPLLAGSMVALVAGFALLASGSGGAASPYLFFLAFVPIVLTIVVPDEPALTLGTGACTIATGAAFELASGASPAHLAFTLAAFGSCTFYGTTSALLYLRMRRREAAAAATRERALAELARSERLRLESERLAAVGQLAAGFSHEVNSPLASAISNLGFVDQELARAGLDPEVAEALRDSKEALGRIRRLVVDLRALTAEVVGQPAEANVAAAVDRAVAMVEARLGASSLAERRLPSDLPFVRASPEQLAQVLCLLIDAVSDRSVPGESLQRVPPSPCSVSAAEVEGGVLVVVEDRAPAAPGLRRPLPVDGPKAPGLSLALCREVARRWGGAIEATTWPDGSSRFALTLRRALV